MNAFLCRVSFTKKYNSMGLSTIKSFCNNNLVIFQKIFNFVFF